MARFAAALILLFTADITSTTAFVPACTKAKLRNLAAIPLAVRSSRQIHNARKSTITIQCQTEPDGEICLNCATNFLNLY